MPFDPEDFTRQAAELVAQGDRVPTQREAWVGTIDLNLEPRPEPWKEGDRILVRPVDGVQYTFLVLDVKPHENGIGSTATVRVV